MFRSVRVLSLIAPVAIASLAAGCGGGGGRQQVTPAELVQKADAICSQERGGFNRIQAHPPPNASVAADQTGELIQITENATSNLRDLAPPDELAATYDRYLDARDQVVDEMNKGKDAAENQDSSAYGAAQAAVANGAPQRRKLAQALGLKVCSSSAATA